MSTRALSIILISIWVFTTLSVPMYVLWFPSTLPSREGELFESFEEGLGRWYSSNKLETCYSDSRDGRNSLKLHWSNGGENTVFAPMYSRNPGVEALLCEVKVSKAYPSCLATSIKPILFFKNKDGGWYQSEGIPIYSSGWMLYRFNVSHDSLDLRPVGINCAWCGQSGRECNEWGLSFSSSGLESAEILVDNVRIVRGKIEKPRVCSIIEGAKALKCYELYEPQFEIFPDPSNPFDPDVADVWGVFYTPKGDIMRVPAFFYKEYRRELKGEREELFPNGLGNWRIRYTPTIPGMYRWEITGTVHGEKISTCMFSFTVTPGESKGFLRVDRSNSSFMFEDKSVFYPIGHNFRSPTDTRTARLLKEITPPDSGTYKYDEVLPKMAAAGENSFELWMASWFGEIEWTEKWKNYHGLGLYNLANAWKLDYIIAKARENGLKVHLVIDNHGQMSTWCDDEWQHSPYNILNGGFILNPDNFWDNEKTVNQYLKKIRYIAARWGFSDTIMGFELVSELDLTGSAYNNYQHQRVIRWHRRVAEKLRACDVNKHIISTHFSTDYTRISPALASDPCLDYIVGDAYRYEGNILDLIIKTDRSVPGILGKKPFFITEFGGNPLGNTLEALEADLHCGLWGTFFTDAAGAPYFWWFDIIEKQNWYSHFKGYSAFCKGEEKSRLSLKLCRARCDKVGVGVRAARGASKYYGWVYNNKLLDEFDRNQAVTSNANVVFSHVPEGSYTYEIWDTFEGTVIDSGNIKVYNESRRQGDLILKLPDFQHDIAFKFWLE